MAGHWPSYFFFCVLMDRDGVEVHKFDNFYLKKYTDKDAVSIFHGALRLLLLLCFFVLLFCFLSVCLVVGVFFYQVQQYP